MEVKQSHYLSKGSLPKPTIHAFVLDQKDVFILKMYKFGSLMYWSILWFPA